jgi:hypothetical protein
MKIWKLKSQYYRAQSDYTEVQAELTVYTGGNVFAVFVPAL